MGGGPVGSITAVTTSAEDAVRRYLAWIDDPDSAVDQDALEAAEAAFAEADDPLQRLHAAAARERASATDVAALERDFVAHAKAYADANHIPATAFAAVGVGADVLNRAGFAIGAGRGRRSSAAAAPRRAPQVSAEAIKAAVDQVGERFTLAQLAEAAGGGSPATVRKAVDELIAAGRVTKLGPDPDHQGPGRAPTQYQRR